MKRVITLCLFVASLAALAVAHGDEQHLMGTVTKITEHTVFIEARDKKIVEIHLAAATKYQKGEKDVTLKDLRVGDRVVVHAKKGAKAIASVIKIGVDAPKQPKQ